MTFDITSMKHSDRWSFKYSRGGIVYNIFLIMMVIFCSFNIYLHVSNENKSDFEKGIDFIHIILNSSAAIFIIVKFSVQQEKFIEIINKFSSIRESLKFITEELLFKKYSVYSDILQIFLPICIIIFLLIVVTIAHIERTLIAALFHFSLYLNVYVCIAFEMQYSVILTYIRQFVKLINFNLLNLSTKNVFAVGSFEIQSLEIDILGVEINKITQLRRLYSSLSDVSQDLSDFYCAQMFLCTLRSFVTLIFLSYSTVSPIIVGTTNSIGYSYIHLILRGLLNITILVILTKSVTAAEIEVRLFQ